MGDCSSGEAQGWDSPLARGILAEFESKVLPKRSMGLHCWETWPLRSNERPLQGSEVCNEGQQLHVLSNRRPKLVEGSQDEDQCILSTCSKIDAGRAKYRGLRQSIPRYGSKQLAEASEVRQVPCKEEAQVSKEGEGSMEAYRRVQGNSGFSAIGPVAEWEPQWDLEDLQEETTMAMGPFEQWEDYFSSETEQVLPYIHGSPRLSYSG